MSYNWKSQTGLFTANIFTILTLYQSHELELGKRFMLQYWDRKYYCNLFGLTLVKGEQKVIVRKEGCGGEEEIRETKREGAREREADSSLNAVRQTTHRTEGEKRGHREEEGGWTVTDHLPSETRCWFHRRSEQLQPASCASSSAPHRCCCPGTTTPSSSHCQVGQ